VSSRSPPPPTEPHKDQITGLTVSWIYPVLILVILSFPPLGGHEIVLLVVGLIWGLWIGFAIAAAGTLIGEVRLSFFGKKTDGMDEGRRN
jgi:uncharacterized membrane protein YdjX (TVP38/TMEM64 family)